MSISHHPSEGRTFTQVLVEQVQLSESPAQVASLVATTFESIARVLAPIVGNRGFTALFNRVVHLTTPVHPWVALLQGDDEGQFNGPSIEPLFGAQTHEEASLAARAMLGSFAKLLTQVVGALLSERMLKRVLADFLHRPPHSEE